MSRGRAGKLGGRLVLATLGALAVSACGVTAALHTSTQRSAVASARAPTSAAPDDGSLKAYSYLPDGRVDKTQQYGRLHTVLTGYTPAEATQRVRAAGYKDEVSVIITESRDPNCKDGTVCSYEPDDWEGNSTTNLLQLRVNRRPDAPDAE